MEIPQGLDYQALATALLTQAGVATKDVSSTPTSIYAHGPGGLFSQPGINRDIVNAMVLPGLRLMAALPPPEMSTHASEVFQILTGQTDGTGSNPTGACDDCPQPGNLKVCNQTYPFGRLCLDSQVLQLDRLGETVNRSDMMDYRMIGDVAAAVPGLFSVTMQQALNSETAKKLLEMEIDLFRRYARLPYTANPTNTAGNTGYLEYNGLDKLVNTGYQDAFTGVNCPAADSIVRSFGGLVVGTNGAAAVNQINSIIRYLRYLAGQLGVDPVQHILVMRYGLFQAFTDIWPCVYATSRCTPIVSAPTSVNVDGFEARRMIDEMRSGSYLLVDGARIPVVVDDAVAETQPVAGTFESDIYVVPTYFAGGKKATYFQFFPMDNEQIREALTNFAPGDMYRVTGDGKYLIHKKPPTNWCVQTSIVTKPRLILRTPFLAARLTDFRYTFEFNHERSGFSDESSFFVDGGQTNWNGIQQSYWTPTD